MTGGQTLVRPIKSVFVGQITRENEFNAWVEELDIS
jgi:hypothetical protein